LFKANYIHLVWLELNILFFHQTIQPQYGRLPQWQRQRYCTVYIRTHTYTTTAERARLDRCVCCIATEEDHQSMVKIFGGKKTWSPLWTIG